MSTRVQKLCFRSANAGELDSSFLHDTLWNVSILRKIQRNIRKDYLSLSILSSGHFGTRSGGEQLQERKMFPLCSMWVYGPHWFYLNGIGTESQHAKFIFKWLSAINTGRRLERDTNENLFNKNKSSKFFFLIFSSLKLPEPWPKYVSLSILFILDSSHSLFYLDRGGNHLGLRMNNL